MRKKIFIVALVCFTFFVSVGVSASVDYTEDFALDVIKGLDIMIGDSYGNMNLNNFVTRAEFAKIAVNTSQYKDTVAFGAKMSVFRDCTYTHWAAPYVKVAVTNKIITGYPDGTFCPDNTVNFEEAVTVMLRLIGYTDEDFGNTWPYGQMSLGKNIGLTENITKNIGEPLTRLDVLKLVYNTLNAKKKGGDKEYYYDTDAVLYDNVIIIATNVEDTSVAPGYVMTSAGTFKCNYDYISPYIGFKGSLATRTNGEVFSFCPQKSISDEYVVYSVLSDSMLVYYGENLTELKLSANTPVYSGTDKLTFSSIKSSVKTGDVIRTVMTADGLIDYLTLEKDTMVGPETLISFTANWYEKYTKDVNTLSVLRNGEKTGVESVSQNDIIYYSPKLNTVFAYSKKITGVYEEALPNKEMPSSVIVSGKEYKLESVEAFQKLSATGNIKYGTTVILLLGKDSEVADVMLNTASQSSSTKEYVVYSVLSESLIVYSNGNLSELKVNGNTPVYSGTDKMVFSGAKTSFETGDVINAVIDEDNEVDYITLTTDSMKGPYTLNTSANDWYKDYMYEGVIPSVIRNGEKADVTSVVRNDIIYYSQKLNTVFAYSKQITGVYEEAIPNKETPSSVIISGKEYAIESVEAFKKLSSAGNIKYGTTVTLLLGKNSQIADVLTLDNIYNHEEVVGYLSSTGTNAYEESGENYTSKYVAVTLPDGTTNEYRTTRDYSSLINSVVKVTFEGSNAVISVVKSNGISGNVQISRNRIGSEKLAQDVEILDVSTTQDNYQGTAINVFPERIDGVTLSASSVLWYGKNSSGEINKLILNDVTGDTASYGIISDYSENKGGGGMVSSVSGSYTIDCGTSQLRYTGGIFSNLKNTTPVKVMVSNGNVQTISALKMLSGTLSELESHRITVNGINYLLSNNLLIYRRNNVRDYSVMTLSELVENYKDYNITAFYDKSEKNGGRIRILLVNKKQ